MGIQTVMRCRPNWNQVLLIKQRAPAAAFVPGLSFIESKTRFIRWS